MRDLSSEQVFFSALRYYRVWFVLSAPCSCGLLILVLKSGSRSSYTVFDESWFAQTHLSLSCCPPNANMPHRSLAFCSVPPTKCVNGCFT